MYNSIGVIFHQIIPTAGENKMKKKLLVLYKTHLDIGFTDLSTNIVDLYLTNYIPKAINTALELNSDNERAFV